MSHFSVCVVIPQNQIKAPVNLMSIEDALDGIMAPFDEQTENAAFQEFEDKTEEAEAGYQKDTTTVVQFPGGRTVSIYDGEFRQKFAVDEDIIYELKRNEGGREKVQTDESRAMKLVRDYPVSKQYTFEEYCEDYCGYHANAAGQWGYTSNPNAKWDWYCVGGRFPGSFLVNHELKECVMTEADNSTTAGFKCVDAARKRDICWEKAKTLSAEAAEARYKRYVAAFESGDVSDLGFFAHISEEGILGWSDVLYAKGETLEEFKARKGLSESDQYMVSSYAFVDAEGDWHSSGDMGWFGVSMNDKPERTWHDELQALMAEVADDDFLVLVDCHI